MPVRKPTQVSELGERIASLAASFEAEKDYNHDRWHKLNNDLTPIVNLPERLTRDIAKLQGTFDGRIASVSKEVERSITAAIEKAIDPVRAEVRENSKRIEMLEAANIKADGVKGALAWFFHSPVSAWLAAAVVILWDKITGVAP